MPENKPLTPSQVAANLKKTLPDAPIRPVIIEIGEIVYVGDGICKIKGLPSVRIEEVVDIETKAGITQALVLGISGGLIEAVVLDEYISIRQGDVVRSTGKLLVVPSGPQVLGRVLNPLGKPVDGKAPVKSDISQQVERIAPGVAKRQPVTKQLESGILVVDATIPLGKGQRELIIGDRKSGKTSLIAGMIMNQKGKDMICIYVAIGAQKAKVRAFEQTLRAAGAMDYTCIVMGSSDDPPSLNYIAPYTGSAIAEYFTYAGKDALIIYDDLSKHAKAYRQMSLLLKRSPGRDAYPGDIFYLHSRLLERSAMLHDSIGGGSLTGFPVVETQNGDLSEYISTNLMSITDGHIYLDINLMHEGILPAVNSGASVSRIGGGVQPPALRKVGELAGTQIARYNEVKSFETLNTEISEDTEREIKRGKRILEVFAQALSLNMANDEKILLMYAVTAGLTDDIEVLDLNKIKVELIEFYRGKTYKDYKEKSTVEKDLAALEPLMMQIYKDYAKFSSNKGARYLTGEKPTETEKAAPITPENDTAEKKDGNAKPTEATETKEETKPEEKPQKKEGDKEKPAPEKNGETKDKDEEEEHESKAEEANFYGDGRNK